MACDRIPANSASFEGPAIQLVADYGEFVTSGGGGKLPGSGMLAGLFVSAQERPARNFYSTEKEPALGAKLPDDNMQLHGTFTPSLLQNGLIRLRLFRGVTHAARSTRSSRYSELRQHPPDEHYVNHQHRQQGDPFGHNLPHHHYPATGV
jgi:hypothetical protein